MAESSPARQPAAGTRLLEEAGWEVRDGALRNAKGEPLVLEYLDSNESGARVVSPWIRNLEKLGSRS